LYHNRNIMTKFLFNRFDYIRLIATVACSCSLFMIERNFFYNDEKFFIEHALDLKHENAPITFIPRTTDHLGYFCFYITIFPMLSDKDITTVGF